MTHRSIAARYVVPGKVSPKPILVSDSRGHLQHFRSLTNAARILTQLLQSLGSDRRIRWWQLEHAATIGQPLTDPDLGQLTVLFAHKVEVQ
jgi:hypothetical protein